MTLDQQVHQNDVKLHKALRDISEMKLRIAYLEKKQETMVEMFCFMFTEIDKPFDEKMDDKEVRATIKQYIEILEVK